MSEPPLLDEPRILRTLNDHRVEYLIVGGVATRLHGAQRPTFDLDVVPITDADNLDRLAAALRELNAFPHADRPKDRAALPELVAMSRAARRGTRRSRDGRSPDGYRGPHI